jgi:hypothetical protein
VTDQSNWELGGELKGELGGGKEGGAKGGVELKVSGKIGGSHSIEGEGGMTKNTKTSFGLHCRCIDND